MKMRAQGPGEEIANSVSHGLALVVAMAAVPALLGASGQASTASLVGVGVFAATMVLLYFTSTVYHALPESRAKRVFLKLDHGAIYLFIAGSYTPFALGVPDGSIGWAPLALVWSMAVAGLLCKALDRLSHPGLSTGLYVVMGWTVLAAALPLLERIPARGTAWLVAGGVAYTAGVLFFALDSRMRYAHAVWHGFVAAGTGCHCLAVLACSA